MGVIDIVIRQQRELAALRAENAQLRYHVSELQSASSGLRAALNVAWAIITHSVSNKKESK